MIGIILYDFPLLLTFMRLQNTCRISMFERVKGYTCIIDGHGTKYIVEVVVVVCISF